MGRRLQNRMESSECWLILAAYGTQGMAAQAWGTLLLCYCLTRQASPKAKPALLEVQGDPSLGLTGTMTMYLCTDTSPQGVEGGESGWAVREQLQVLWIVP